MVGSAKGTWIIPVNQTVTLQTSESLSDYVGRPVTDSPFTLNRLNKNNCSGLSGTSKASGWSVTMDRYPGGHHQSYAYAHVNTGAPAFASLGISILSKTNPSRSNILPLTLVQDLHDIPRMLRDVGKLLRTPRRLLSAKELANAHLGARFGWLPLIHDVQTLLGIQQYIGSRAKELRRLYEGQGLRRKVRLNSFSAADHLKNQTMWSANWTGLIRGDISLHTQIKEWGTVRWKPTNLPFPGWQPSDAEINQKAMQLALGLTTEGVIQGAWDVLPWTWLVDWFTNASDYLTVHSSTIPASPSHINTMRSTTTLGQHTIQSKLPDGVRDGGGTVTRTTLQRVPGTGLPIASLPTLDVSRLSILGSLFVQRFK